MSIVVLIHTGFNIYVSNISFFLYDFQLKHHAEKEGPFLPEDNIVTYIFY